LRGSRNTRRYLRDPSISESTCLPRTRKCLSVLLHTPLQRTPERKTTHRSCRRIFPKTTVRPTPQTRRIDRRNTDLAESQIHVAPDLQSLPNYQTRTPPKAWTYRPATSTIGHLNNRFRARQRSPAGLPRRSTDLPPRTPLGS